MRREAWRIELKFRRFRDKSDRVWINAFKRLENGCLNLFARRVDALNYLRQTNRKTGREIAWRVAKVRVTVDRLIEMEDTK